MLQAGHLPQQAPALGHKSKPVACKLVPSCKAPSRDTRRAVLNPAHTSGVQQTRQQQPAQWILHAVRADAPSAQVDTATLQLISDVTSQVNTEHDAILTSSARAAVEAGAAEGETTELKAKIMASIQKVATGLLERETEVRLMLLAALAGEHLLLLGPPGTAKSELSRRLSRLTGGRYFERLLTRFSVPEELFGPLSMQGLENDEYIRQINGYLPTAEVAFIDEIFKANSAILNALLTLLNERLFDNGNQRFTVPLLCLVGASNELPESEELDALYDRFLLRRSVAQVSSGQLAALARLAAGANPAAHAAGDNGAANTAVVSTHMGDMTLEEFRSTAGKAYRAVELPQSVIDILCSLRDYLQDKCEPPVYVSDRRFMKAINLLQVAAFADGREMINEYDCLLLEFVFGNRPDDAHKVRAYVLDTIASDPGLQQTELVFLGLFGRSCRILDSQSKEELPEAREEAASLVELLGLRQASLAVTLDGGFPDLRTSIWQSEAAVQAAVQALTPQLTENKKRVEDLLREAMILKEALSHEGAPGLLEKLLPKRYKQYQKGITTRV